MERFSKTLFILLISSIFFPVRYVFPSDFSLKLGLYSDFTSFSLYLSDIVIILLFFLNIRVIWGQIKERPLIIALLVGVIISLLLHAADWLPYNVYFAGRLLLLLTLYLAVANKMNWMTQKGLALLFAALGALQSVIALIQFLTQQSLGLYKVGESPLGLAIVGASKTVSHGTEFVRGYGTFPHPNVLSGVLSVAILFCIYLIFTSETKKQRFIYSALLVLNVYGLVASLSRAGIGATLLGSALLLGGLLLWQRLSRKLLWTVAVVVIAFIGAFATFQQFLSDRATISDQAVTQRVVYNDIAQNIIKTYPWQGIGLGTSILHMQQFSSVHLEPWEIQPIHNYYLLTAAELGILGALLLLVFFLQHLLQLARGIISRFDPFHLTLFSILMSCLALMFFDHYFYTLAQAQLLLWLVLAVIAGTEYQNSIKSSS